MKVKLRRSPHRTRWRIIADDGKILAAGEEDRFEVEEVLRKIHRALEEWVTAKDLGLPYDDMDASTRTTAEWRVMDDDD